MADWKQITARIRRARTAKDPALQLASLYEKTQDAMVAFELARFFETSAMNADAAKWYVTASERFRRSDWKLKAREAATRLGGTVTLDDGGTISTASADNKILASGAAAPGPEMDIALEEDTVSPASHVEDQGMTADRGMTPAGLPAKSLGPAIDRNRRRGRRGGRNRRKDALPGTSANVSDRAAAEPPALHAASEEIPLRDDSVPSVTERGAKKVATEQLPAELITDSGAPSVKGRYGDPGLSSRISLLEMQFRRLLSCPPVSLNEADQAPAGPGVFVLTDSDLTGCYYVEACQTLRIAVGNLARGGSSRRGPDSIKPQLAHHLGIPEARVTKYLADHCVVR